MEPTIIDALQTNLYQATLTLIETIMLIASVAFVLLTAIGIVSTIGSGVAERHERL
jgi:hypothetical protein